MAGPPFGSGTVWNGERRYQEVYEGMPDGAIPTWEIERRDREDGVCRFACASRIA